jgi:hypothetical protein
MTTPAPPIAEDYKAIAVRLAEIEKAKAPAKMEPAPPASGFMYGELDANYEEILAWVSAGGAI